MKHSVTLDRSGIALDDKPLYLLAGQVHYFRYPRAEWRELLLIAKAGGLNTIDTVIPWNRHEPQLGEFDFAEEADLAAFLDLCAELGLWAIVRPGPYICAEWENGGFPAWLTAQPDLTLRLDDPLFLAHTMRWFDVLFEILTPRQAANGGPIILCQIENEHWASGRYGHDLHQQTLADAALARGMLAPQYTCMGATPGYAEFRNGWSGIAEKLVQTRALWPENPMIVSELWSGWFDNWGASRHAHKTAARFEIILQQLIAVGASGFSHWMWAGGTNFGFWGGRTVGGDTVHMTTSYDYDAPVSEYLGVTPKFYAARRQQLFLSTLGATLAPILADAVAGGSTVIVPGAVAGRGEAGAQPYRNVRASSAAPEAWRDFTATFLSNVLPEGLVHQVFLRKPARHLAIEIEPTSIRPIFSNMPLGEQLVLSCHSGRILGFWTHDKSDTLVMYGSGGEMGLLELRGGLFALADQLEPALDVQIADHQLELRYCITDRPQALRCTINGRALTVLLLSTERAERLWPLADGTFVCGPNLVLVDTNETYVESRGLHPFYEIRNGYITLNEKTPAPGDAPKPFVLAWQQHAVAEVTAQEGWQPLEGPKSLDQSGLLYGYGWYRTKLYAEKAGVFSLAAPAINDRARLIVDGVDHGWLGIDPNGPQLARTIELTAGDHDLRVLVDNLGRFNYGSNTGEQKGLLDTFYPGEQHDLTSGWVALWQEAAFAGEAIANAKPWAVRPDATNVALDNFAFQGSTVWLLRAFEAEAGKRYMLHLTGDRNSGALFVNGATIARFSRHYGGGFIQADITDHVRPGTNVIALNILNYAGIAWHAHLLAYDPQQPLTEGWSIRGGVTPAEPAPAATGPRVLRATFQYDPQIHGAGPWKLYPTGLRKGQIWLNGRGVGRYWQRGPQEAYKLPASWFQPTNELLIFEEEAVQPDQVSIAIDQVGERHWG